MMHIGAVLLPIRSEYLVDLFCLICRDERVAVADNFSRFGIYDVTDGVSARNTVCKCFDYALFVSDCRDERTLGVSAILLAHDDGVRYVDKTSGEVT